MNLILISEFVELVEIVKDTRLNGQMICLTKCARDSFITSTSVLSFFHILFIFKSQGINFCQLLINVGHFYLVDSETHF